MPDLPSYLAFLAAVLAWQLAPGPESMLVVSRGIGQGWRVALCTVLGMTLLAGLVQVPLLALGVASLVASSPWVFEALRWAGALYLIWLGGRLILTRGDRHRLAAVPLGHRYSAARSLREGLIANLANPSPWIFMLAFLPQFVDPAEGPVGAQLLVFGLTQKLTGAALLGTTGLAAGAVGDWLARRPGVVIWQERLAGSIMICLGLRLLFGGGAKP